MTKRDAPMVVSAGAATEAGDGIGRVVGDLPERLLAWLRERFADDRIAYSEPPAPMRGGHDTLTCRFALRNAPPGLEHPLVVRIYPRSCRTDRIVRERLFMGALAATALPVPRVHAVETGNAGLGGAFLVLQLCPGAPLSAAPHEIIPGMMGEIHAMLHEIDPAPLIESFRARGWKASRYRLDLDLDFERVTARTRGLSRLRPVADWLAAHRPRGSGRPAICHGDFHAGNILVRDGEVTGVVDWSDAFIADSEMDVARTMSHAPIVARYFPSFADPFQAAKHYLACYRRRRAIDVERLDWYRVRYCLMDLTDTGGVWSRGCDPRLAADFAAEIERVTGIAVAPA